MAGKNGLKLRKRVFNNAPLMVKNVRDKAGTALMGTRMGCENRQKASHQVPPTPIQVVFWLFRLWASMGMHAACLLRARGSRTSQKAVHFLWLREAAGVLVAAKPTPGVS